jgi:hypothetical protein
MHFIVVRGCLHLASTLSTLQPAVQRPQFIAGELEWRSLARVTTTVALNRKSVADSRLTAD